MSRARVVIRATMNGNTLSPHPDENPYTFAKGDMGVLEWGWHKEDPAYLEPLVIWDRDNQHHARRVSYTAVREIGIEQNGIRFCLDRDMS